MSSAHEDVQKLAYRLWQERGCPPDSPDADWYRAEQELSEAHAAPDGDETLARPPAPPARARARTGTGARQKAEHNA